MQVQWLLTGQAVLRLQPSCTSCAGTGVQELPGVAAHLAFSPAWAAGLILSVGGL